MTRLFFYFVIILASLLTACRNHKSDDRPTLTVSIEPLRYVTEAIAGDRYRVHTIMPQGASPETYEPTPRQMVELSKSGLVFRAGALGFEGTKLPALVQANPNCRLVDLGQGITLIESGCQGQHGHAESGDPHTWMSPANLSIMAANACKALCEADTAGKSYYLERLAKFQAQMRKLDRQLQNELRPLKQRTFLIYHPALGYFARSYGLHQLAVEHDGKEPSAAHIRDLADECRKDGVNTVFISKEHNGQAARRLAEEIHARIVNINPLDYDVPAQMLFIAQSLNHGK